MAKIIPTGPTLKDIRKILIEFLANIALEAVLGINSELMGFALQVELEDLAQEMAFGAKSAFSAQVKKALITM